MKSSTLLVKSLAGNYVTSENSYDNQNINSVDAQHFLTDVVTTR